MDLTQLSPEQLAGLKAQLDALTPVAGRSPFRPRQLHDLRLQPTADDPRPTFFWSAEAPRDGRDLSRMLPYPRLMWHVDTGEEITVTSAQDEREHEDCYTVQPPSTPVMRSNLDAMRDVFAGLTEDERAMVIEAQKRQRMGALQAKLAGLTEAQLASLVADVETAATAKRGPGRPKKEAVA